MRDGNRMLNFGDQIIVEEAGGPAALQTSPPVKKQYRVDTNPHAALAGLTCRASPANTSVAGAAPLDSVRLRRNRSLLLCGTQSSSLTCARGADRACARARSKPQRYALATLTALVPVRGQSRPLRDSGGGNARCESASPSPPPPASRRRRSSLRHRPLPGRGRADNPPS